MTAVLSPCGTYRYRLERTWLGHAPSAVFVMLNPSTADATQDDPTIRRCVGFAKRWGYGGIVVVNLFAIRSPDPAALTAHPDPVGPDNDAVLEAMPAEGAAVDFIAAWGAHKAAAARAAYVTGLLADCGARVDCLGRTKAGAPRHPLYVPAAQAAQPYAGSAV